MKFICIIACVSLLELLNFCCMRGEERVMSA